MELNKLLPDYYEIEGCNSENGHTLFNIRIKPDSSVYQGHFPGHPICPGVCNIQMIKECVEQVLQQQLTFHNIKQCRFVSLMKPTEHTEVQIDIQTDEKNPRLIKASLFSGETTFLEIKGEVCNTLNA